MIAESQPMLAPQLGEMQFGQCPWLLSISKEKTYPFKLYVISPINACHVGCSFDSTLSSGSGQVPSFSEAANRDSRVQGHWDRQLKPTA